MRRLSGAVSFLFAALALISACGQQHIGNGGPLAGQTSAASSPVTACSGTPQDHTVNLTVSDDGKTLCVRQGVGVLVTLQGTTASKWAPIQASSTALSPRANGRLALQVGVTGAYFVAAHPGVSVITSARAACPGTPSASPSPGGTVSCAARLAYHVTVRVIG